MLLKSTEEMVLTLHLRAAYEVVYHKAVASSSVGDIHDCFSEPLPEPLQEISLNANPPRFIPDT